MVKADSDKMKQSAFSIVDCLNSEIENFLLFRTTKPSTVSSLNGSLCQQQLFTLVFKANKNFFDFRICLESNRRWLNNSFNRQFFQKLVHIGVLYVQRLQFDAFWRCRKIASAHLPDVDTSAAVR